MNAIQLTGRLTAEPEQRTTTSGKAVCNFTIAVNRTGSEQADFVRCTAWDKVAESICKYKHQGDLVGIIGSLRVESFVDKENRRREKIFVNVSQAEFIGGKREPAPGESTETVQIPDGADDDFPF